MQGEQSLGPYTGEQLVEFARAGNVTREMLIWTEGMAEWLAAEKIEGLFPAPVAAVPVRSTVAHPGARWAPGGLHQSAAGPATLGEYPHFPVSGASFGLWIGLLLGGVVLFILAPVVGISLGQREETAAMGGMLALGFMAVAWLLTVFSGIVGMMYLHRAWSCIQPGGLARSTPGKAVGFLFIPFFNLYWMFMAWKGLAEDWNRTVSSYEDLKAAPRLSEGLFLTFCILVFFGLSVFVMFPVMSQLCRGINFFAFRPLKTTGGVGFRLR